VAGITIRRKDPKMCEKCLLKLSKDFKDWSEREPQMSNILEDMSLLCFTAAQFKHPVTLNTILGIARICVQGEDELGGFLMANIAASITALSDFEVEELHDPSHGSL
jgi:hypothetical protein